MDYIIKWSVTPIAKCWKQSSIHWSLQPCANLFPHFSSTAKNQSFQNKSIFTHWSITSRGLRQCARLETSHQPVFWSKYCCAAIFSRAQASPFVYDPKELIAVPSTVWNHSLLEEADQFKVNALQKEEPRSPLNFLNNKKGENKKTFTLENRGKNDEEKIWAQNGKPWKHTEASHHSKSLKNELCETRQKKNNKNWTGKQWKILRFYSALFAL